VYDKVLDNLMFSSAMEDREIRIRFPQKVSCSVDHHSRRREAPRHEGIVELDRRHVMFDNIKQKKCAFFKVSCVPVLYWFQTCRDIRMEDGSRDSTRKGLEEECCR